MINQQLYLSQTENKGRGVYTKEALKADTTIEISPVIIMSDTDRQLLDKTLLHDYIFEWLPEGQPPMCCMALGWVPLYNHSYQSNAEYWMNYDDNTIAVKTVRDIKPGEEVTINYNGDWDNVEKVWFDVK